MCGSRTKQPEEISRLKEKTNLAKAKRGAFLRGNEYKTIITTNTNPKIHEERGKAWDSAEDNAAFGVDGGKIRKGGKYQA